MKRIKKGYLKGEHSTRRLQLSPLLLFTNKKQVCDIGEGVGADPGIYIYIQHFTGLVNMEMSENCFEGSMTERKEAYSIQKQHKERGQSKINKGREV